ncbi:hypothetical protein [Aminobacter sp. LjRoot7]|uniref:hypothetical protein n=1 Tax=Aminobacter sp. LjRoot7 TaxID=3342335 RepID=UPI003ECF4EFA
MRLFSPFPATEGGEIDPRHEASGHDSAAERTVVRRLVVSREIQAGRLRPAAIVVCGEKRRTKEEDIDE